MGEGGAKPAADRNREKLRRLDVYPASRTDGGRESVTCDIRPSKALFKATIDMFTHLRAQTFSAVNDLEQWRNRRRNARYAPGKSQHQT